MQTAVQAQIVEKEHRLSQTVLRLRAAGPEETLRRGYALLLRDRNLIRSVEGVEIGQEMDIRLADGLLGVRVERIEREENHGGQNQENGIL